MRAHGQSLWVSCAKAAKHQRQGVLLNREPAAPADCQFFTRRAFRVIKAKECSMATKKPRPAASKVKAVSLHIGLNGVSGAAYGGWTGPLAAGEFDAKDKAAPAK